MREGDVTGVDTDPFNFPSRLRDSRPMIDKFRRAVICLHVSFTDRYLPLSVLRESLGKHFTLRDIPFKTGTLNMRLGQNNAADLYEVLLASGHPADLATAINAAMVPDFVIGRNKRLAAAYECERRLKRIGHENCWRFAFGSGSIKPDAGRLSQTFGKVRWRSAGT